MSPELHQHYPLTWSALEVVLSGFFNTVGLFETCSTAQCRAARMTLNRVGIGRGHRDALGALTFGQQRLVLLARALVKPPQLLILDEPCQGLDSAQRRHFLGLVDQVMEPTRMALIFVTHHAAELPNCITHCLRLAHGKIGSIARTRRRPGMHLRIS
jgi:molybdate transport system ATP-binding protein